MKVVVTPSKVTSTRATPTASVAVIRAVKVSPERYNAATPSKPTVGGVTSPAMSSTMGPSTVAGLPNPSFSSAVTSICSLGSAVCGTESSKVSLADRPETKRTMGVGDAGPTTLSTISARPSSSAASTTTLKVEPGRISLGVPEAKLKVPVGNALGITSRARGSLSKVAPKMSVATAVTDTGPASAVFGTVKSKETSAVSPLTVTVCDAGSMGPTTRSSTAARPSTSAACTVT